MREDWDQAVQGQFDEVKTWSRKLEQVERQIEGLSSFAAHVEKFLEAKYSSADGATALASKGHGRKSSRESRGVSTEHTSGASSSSARTLHYIQIPEPPGIPAPPTPNETPQPDAQPVLTTHLSTLRSEVRAGAIRVDISNPEQWSPGDTAILKNKEAGQVRNTGSLIFETPIQDDYEAGVDVRSLLPSERLEEMEVRWAVTDVDSSGNRRVKFWVDEASSSPTDESMTPRSDETSSHVPPTHSSAPPFPSLNARSGERAPPSPERRGRPPHDHSSQGSGSPDFGGGVRFDDEMDGRGHIPGYETQDPTNHTNPTSR